jgi:hypothetical protein
MGKRWLGDVMPSSQSSPASSQMPFPEHEVRPQTWKMPLHVLGSVAFVLAGVWLLIVNDDVTMKLAGLLSIAFFGLAGVMGARQLLAAREGGGALIRVRPDGLELPVLGSAGAVGVLPWEDIGSFGVIKVGGIDHTAIRLLRYERFLEGITDADATSTLALYGRMQKAARFGRFPLAALQLSQLDDPSETVRSLGRFGPVADLGGLLSQFRKTYGAEFLLPWHMLDRSAAEFAIYLETCQHQALAATRRGRPNA